MLKVRKTLHMCKKFNTPFIKDKFSTPFIKDKFSTPFIKDKFSTPFIKDKFSTPFIKDKFIMSTSVLSQSFSTKHLLNLKHATKDRNNIFQARIHTPLNPCQSFCTNNDTGDNIQDEEPTIESKLIAFMDRWDIEKAVTLLRESIDNGIFPNQSVVINLLQLLGNLGDFECLLSLREILKDNKLCSNERFFGCLQEAYYNSGRIEEAVLLLRILYHDVRNYDTVDIFFTLIGMMILVHFPHRLDLIESFAKDCREKEPPDYLPTAELWKCFILSKNFEKAEDLVSDHEKIQEHLHKMTGHILSRKNKVQVDRICILKYLSQNSADYRIKTRSEIYRSLILELVSERRWDELLDTLNEMSEKELKFADTRNFHYHISKAEDILFNCELDNFKLVQCIEKLKNVCEQSAVNT